MSDLNLSPYTVTTRREGDFLITHVRRDGVEMSVFDHIDPDQLAALLNAAYAKGVEDERATATEASLHLTAELTRLAADACAYGKRHDDGRLAVCLRSDLEFVAKAIEQHGHVEQKVKGAYHLETIRLELARQPEDPKVNPS